MHTKRFEKHVYFPILIMCDFINVEALNYRVSRALVKELQDLCVPHLDSTLSVIYRLPSQGLREDYVPPHSKTGSSQNRYDCSLVPGTECSLLWSRVDNLH